MSAPRFGELHDWMSTDEVEVWESEEWWCPSGEAWTMCPGPCPDGREHGPKRIERIEGYAFVSASTGIRTLFSRGPASYSPAPVVSPATSARGVSDERETQ